MAQEVLFKWSSVEKKKTKKDKCKKDTLGTQMCRLCAHMHTQNVSYKTKEFYSFKSGLTTQNSSFNRADHLFNQIDQSDKNEER